MTLALATRGYLCHCRIVNVGEGPAIVAAEEATPVVQGTTMTQSPAPKIRRGKKVEPTIQGAVEEPDPPPAKPPSGKGKKIAPIIRKAKKG